MAIAKNKCELCLGAKGGTPGNENIIGGHVVCDYCTSLLMDMDRQDATVEFQRDRLLLACKWIIDCYDAGIIEGGTMINRMLTHVSTAINEIE